jgi:hypothetical protein
MEEQPIWGLKMSTTASYIGVHTYPTLLSSIRIVSKPPKSNQGLALLLKQISAFFILLCLHLGKCLDLSTILNRKDLLAAILFSVISLVSFQPTLAQQRKFCFHLVPLFEICFSLVLFTSLLLYLVCLHLGVCLDFPTPKNRKDRLVMVAFIFYAQ